MSAFDVKIRCGSCNKNKSQELYSKRSLTRYRDSQRMLSRNSQQPIKPIFCLGCNQGNRDELTCCHCDRTMALEKFNKTQRRQNDNAEKVDREPDHQKEVDEVIIIDEINRSEIAGYSQTSSRLGSTHPSQLQSNSSQWETETNPNSESGVDGNDAVSLASGFSTDTNPRRTTGTGWDACEGIPRNATGSRGGSNTGFVKQNAVPRNPWDKANAAVEREQRRIQEQEEVVRDESDDSDDDQEPPY